VHLNDEHIAYIRKDLYFRGIVIEEIDEELVDHICSAVEAEMQKGRKFIDAYQHTLEAFGHASGLTSIQAQTVKIKTKKPSMMLGNYITIAWRNSRKYAMFTFINVTGLALGIATCTLIFLYLANEFSFDRYHKNGERIYRITNETTYNGIMNKSVNTPHVLAKTLTADFAEVERAVHLPGQGLFFVKRAEGTNNIKVDWATFTSNDVFKVFSIPFIDGDPSTALSEPNTIVISEQTARALFNNEPAMNQQLILDNHLHVKVVGVYRDLPENGHFRFKMLVSEAGTEPDQTTQWVNDNLSPTFQTKTYVLLKPEANVSSFETKLQTLISHYIIPEAGEIFQSGEANRIVYSLQRLYDIHFETSFEGDFEAGLDKSYVYILAAIAVFILLIASVNFINLSTARSSTRAKEVGMRKVMGSLRVYLVRQFLAESIVLSFLATVAALIIAWSILPLFNNISGTHLEFPSTRVLFYAVMFAAALILGFLAGLYPAFFLSAFKPVQVLKGNVSIGMKSSYVRGALVVSQFAISIFLIIGTIVLLRQLEFIHNKNLGFIRENVINVQETYLLRNQKTAYKDEVLKNSIFISGTISGFLPAAGPWRLPRSWWREGKQSTESVTVQDWSIDQDYVETLGMKILAGRNFQKGSLIDTVSVLVNEAAVKRLGLSTNPVGKTITTYSAFDTYENDPADLTTFTVVGVVGDFHFESLRQPIGPIVFRLNHRPSGSIVFRFQEGKAGEVVSVLEEQWRKMAPGEPFTYDFMDSGFTSIYKSEERLTKIFGIFTSIALLVACLGLYALVTFSTEQRRKEIGIRKVLGASVKEIVMMFSKELGKLVFVAFLLAAPLAAWAARWWLESYSYKIDVGVTVYVAAGFFAIAVAWVTTCFQSIRSANADPVKSLRSE
jgi:putative ABC transport system permease protein